MAEKRDIGLKDLEDEITCGICHEHALPGAQLRCFLAAITIASSVSTVWP